MSATESRMIAIPERVAKGDLVCVVSVSGGKDSAAVALALREAEVPFRMVFADTGWEAPETYAHLDYLREKLGPIDVVGKDGGMVGRIRYTAGFPSKFVRWCTRELKVEPLRAYHDAIGAETVSVVGIRADESVARRDALAFEDCDRWGGFVWRPIVDWTVSDVIAIHRRHGVAMNPLYHRGHNRVGCYPCIFANKEEIMLTADASPARIAEIRALEAETTVMRAERNEAKPGRYSNTQGSYFQATPGRTNKSGYAPIDEVVAWSRTSRGGRQLPLLAPPPEGGCFRWGMCEVPPKETK
jgi:3'-phosphoadenosine 5'-phosphosulfate sulfotransferase (PAPS reductase)/FAD synthetase